MCEEKPGFLVVPTTKEMIEFDCGHTGPADYEHVIFGKTCVPTPEMLADRTLCGQCKLDAVASTATRCFVCGRPIFKGQDCLNDKGVIICMGVKCSVGPMGIDPGVWRGDHWEHGLHAGTMQIFGRSNMVIF